MTIKKYALFLLLLIIVLSGCAQTGSNQENNYESENTPQILSGRESESTPSKPVALKSSEVVISTETGKASFYSDQLHGKSTASGELYDRNKLTAAHRKLPFGTICRVTNLANGKNVKVRINDRGPFTKSRIIDLSYKAAVELDAIKAGIIKVRIEVLENKTK